MRIWQLTYQSKDKFVIETYKEFEYALEQYNKLVNIWKAKPNVCEFINEDYGREFGYYRTSYFSNDIQIKLYGDVLRELKNKIGFNVI